MAAQGRITAADDDYLRCIWRQLRGRLEEWRADWPASISQRVMAASVDELLAGSVITDREVFEAFAVALLSGNTRWDRIERIRHELGEPFEGFDPQRFSLLTAGDVERRVVPWFRDRKAGAPDLGAALSRLRLTASKLATHAAAPASAQTFLRDAAAASDGTPEGLAVVLGTSKMWKLPGFGVALAAEALRILGLDVCKPDRHVLRAIAAWRLVGFRHWDRRGAFTAPQANTGELHATMLAVRAIARVNGMNVRFANSVIWTAGAVSGARLANDELETLWRRCGSSAPEATV